MGLSRHEYWSGLPFPFPGDLQDPGIKPGFPALQSDTLTSEPPGKPQKRKDDLNRSRLPFEARRGDSQPNDQSEHQEGSGRLHIYREVCGSNKGNVNQAGYFEYSLVEMTFVVGQGVISLLDRCRGLKVSGQGVISPR